MQLSQGPLFVCQQTAHLWDMVFCFFLETGEAGNAVGQMCFARVLAPLNKGLVDQFTGGGAKGDFGGS